MLEMLLRPIVAVPVPRPGERVEYLDVAKGISIVLVAWAHTWIAPSAWLQRFAVFTFFFISGVFLHTSETPRVFLRKKWYELIGPLVFFSLLGVAMEVCVCGLRHWHEPGVWTFMRIANSPLWFLLVLIYCSLAGYAIERYVRLRWARIAIYGVCVAIGWWLGARRMFVPGYFGNLCLILPIYISGHYLRRYLFAPGLLLSPLAIAAAVAGAVYGEVRHIITHLSVMVFSPHYLPSMVAGYGWMLVVLQVSLLIGRSAVGRFFAWLGRNTLMILGLHLFFMIPVREEWYRLLGLEHTRAWSTDCLVSLAIALAVCVVCVWIGRPIRRACTWFFGAPRVFSTK